MQKEVLNWNYGRLIGLGFRGWEGFYVTIRANLKCTVICSETSIVEFHGDGEILCTERRNIWNR